MDPGFRRDDEFSFAGRVLCQSAGRQGRTDARFPLSTCHPDESRDPLNSLPSEHGRPLRSVEWIPAFAGMTNFLLREESCASRPADKDAQTLAPLSQPVVPTKVGIH